MSKRKAVTASEPVPQAEVAAEVFALADDLMTELGDVIEAEAGHVGYGMIDAVYCKPLLDAGFVLVNHAIQENGLTAAKSTQAGIDYWQANKPVDSALAVVQTAVNETATATKVNPMSTTAKPSFDVFDDFTPPADAAVKSRAGRTDVYPFDKLAVGQSFFVPATEKRPEPWKSLQSTVTQAMGRYATETGATKVVKSGKTLPVKQRVRVFKLYQHERNGTAGAVVMRAPDAAVGTPDDASE